MLSKRLGIRRCPQVRSSTTTVSPYVTGLWSPTLVIPEGLAAGLDPKAREAAYKKALSKISGELYWLPMFTYAKYYAWAKDLDFKTTPDEIPRFYTAKWK